MTGQVKPGLQVVALEKKKHVRLDKVQTVADLPMYRRNGFVKTGRSQPFNAIPTSPKNIIASAEKQNE
jgi:hypothetical protein